MKLKLKSQDMYTIINSLDFYSRIWIGQYNNILFDIRWYRNCKQLDELEDNIIVNLLKIRNLLLPGIQGYGFYGSYGIFNPDVDFRAGISYDMQQAFRYALAYFIHPEGGITVNFNPPIHCDNDPYKFPSVKCYTESNQTYIDIDINEEQLVIIKNALMIKHYEINGIIDKMFEFYTDNQDALEISKLITNCFKDVDLDKQTNTIDKELYVFDEIVRQIENN